MSWIIDSPLSYFQKFCVNVIKAGPVPRHIAFIMDGNRRYASKNNMHKVTGHTRGFDKLAETLRWCFELGIEEVTVYAFSIENFKRSQDEVDALMELAREKYKRLLEEREKLMSEGVCIRVIGNMNLLPEDLRKSIADAMLMTKDNKNLFLNVAFAYTAKDEITNSIHTIMNGVQSEEIDSSDVSEQLITQCMYSGHSAQPDMLIRTSGEVRFSDFLLWQIWNTHIYFTSILWPEFSIWHLLAAVFQYQRRCKDITFLQKPKIQYSENARKFINKVDSDRLAQLELYSKA